MPDRLMSAADVSVLTLTYGDRSAFLKQMIAGVAAEGVRHVMVLANGLAPEPAARLRDLAETAFRTEGVQVDIHDSPVNLGSAAGYARLVRAAVDRPNLAGVWFLDDDNCPRPGALAQLLAASAAGQAETATSGMGVAACAVRTDRQYMLDAAAGRPVRPLYPGEVFGTDLRHVAARAWRRLTRQSARAQDLTPAVRPVSVPYTRVPYGGLFVPASLARAVSPPSADFVIYADDYDYSNRLAQAGGLVLVGGALIDDLEASWNASGDGAGADAVQATAPRRLSQTARLAVMPADFRLYFAVRNAIWLDVQRLTGLVSRLWFGLNLLVFVAPVVIRAALAGRGGNIGTLLLAVGDGVRGRLGPRADFPLP